MVIFSLSNRNILIKISGLHGITQWTLCLKLHILVLFHILSIKLYYLLRCVTYGLEMRAPFLKLKMFWVNHTYRTWTANICKTGNMYITHKTGQTEPCRTTMLHYIKHQIFRFPVLIGLYSDGIVNSGVA